LTSGTLKVVVSNAGNGSYVVADAMRAAPVPVSNTDLTWSATGDGITGPTAVNQQTGFTIARTYTISGAAAPSSFTIAYYASMSANPKQDPTKATWVVTGLASGTYAVEASWGPYYNQSTNAPYAIYDGTTLVQVVTADQTKTPSGASAGGVPFQILTHVTINSGTLTVVLSNSSNNIYVIADALRVE